MTATFSNTLAQVAAASAALLTAAALWLPTVADYPVATAATIIIA